MSERDKHNNLNRKDRGAEELPQELTEERILRRLLDDVEYNQALSKNMTADYPLLGSEETEHRMSEIMPQLLFTKCSQLYHDQPQFACIWQALLVLTNEAEGRMEDLLFLRDCHEALTQDSPDQMAEKLHRVLIEHERYELAALLIIN